MAIQYKRGYGLQYTVHGELSLLPIWRELEAWRYRFTKSAAANPCCLFQISSSVYRCCWHGCHQSVVQVFLIPWFLIFLINRTCRKSNHNHVQCFVCFRNWLIIIEHVLWNLFCLRPKFSNKWYQSGLHVWFIEIFSLLFYEP